MTESSPNPSPQPGATDSPPAEIESSTVISARRVVGRPFQPGVSGNPGGRPRGDAAAKAHVRELSTAVVDRMWALANDPKTPVSEARRLLYDLWVFAWGRPETVSVVRQKLLGQPPAAAGPLVAINVPAGAAGPQMTPEQAYAFLVGNPRAPAPQLEAATRVIEAAAAKQRPAIEGAVADASEAGTVLQMPTRSDTSEAS